LVAFGAFVKPPPRGDGKRFVVRADEKLTAVLELESIVCLLRGAHLYGRMPERLRGIFGPDDPAFASCFRGTRRKSVHPTIEQGFV
jgi:hypothetical protein